MKIESTDNLNLILATTSFAALGSKQRLGVLRALVRAGPDGLSIDELGSRTGVTGSTLTHHVKILALARMVEQVRKGRSIICAAVAYDRIRYLSEFLMTECCADSTSPCEDYDHGRNIPTPFTRALVRQLLGWRMGVFGCPNRADRSA